MKLCLLNGEFSTKIDVFEQIDSQEFKNTAFLQTGLLTIPIPYFTKAPDINLNL